MNVSHVFVQVDGGFVKSQTEHPGGLIKNETSGREKHEITPQSKRKQFDRCSVIQMTVGAPPPSLPLNLGSLKV